MNYRAFPHDVTAGDGIGVTKQWKGGHDCLPRQF